MNGNCIHRRNWSSRDQI